MSVELSTILNYQRNASVEIELTEGGTTRKERINFKHKLYSPALIKEVESAVQADQRLNSDVELLLRLVTEWDIADENGQPLAVSRDTLEALPNFVIEKLWRACTDQTPQAAANA